MKNNKKILKITAVINLVCALIMSLYFTASAHDHVLSVSYDECSVQKNESGEDELWYIVNDIDNTVPGLSIHISDKTPEIKYYFSPSEEHNTSQTWETNIKSVWNENGSYILFDSSAEEIYAEIKNIFVESMTKWNNIYYYSYDTAGNRFYHKIVNISEGTSTDHNLIIYPIDSDIEALAKAIAYVDYDDMADMLPVIESNHYHSTNYRMYIGLWECYKMLNYENSDNPNKYYIYQLNTGAHEIGHILGLADLDERCACPCDLCNDDNTDNNCLGHHEEALMGYGEHSNRVTHITYRDIAGVSITRGFHTDDDHLWMLRENKNEETSEIESYDVICALCNGVRKDIDPTEGEYADLNLNEYVYKSCTHYAGTNEEMILVATDCTRDFYKCRYCRYISEVDHTHRYTEYTENDDYTHIEKCVCGAERENNHNIVCSQTDSSIQHRASCICGYEVLKYHSYTTLENYNSTYHKKVCACGYYSLQLHKYDNYTKISSSKHRGTCDCGATKVENHSFTEWKYKTSTLHIEMCADCGVEGTTENPHVVRASEVIGNRATCLNCGHMINLDTGFAEVIQNISKISINGSYILSNGIIVLVDEDVEAYLNGTLVFYDKDKVPATQ